MLAGKTSRVDMSKPFQIEDVSQVIYQLLHRYKFDEDGTDSESGSSSDRGSIDSDSMTNSSMKIQTMSLVTMRPEGESESLARNARTSP